MIDLPYKDPIKRKEYNKLLKRRSRQSKLNVPDKTVLEQTYENLRDMEEMEMHVNNVKKAIYPKCYVCILTGCTHNQNSEQKKLEGVGNEATN